MEVRGWKLDDGSWKLGVGSWKIKPFQTNSNNIKPLQTTSKQITFLSQKFTIFALD